MKIPSNDQDRLQFYNETIAACFYSQKERIEQYDLLKHYYIYGCAPNGDGTPYNKIDPIVDTLTAFLYSADSTRFSAHLGPEVPAIEWDKVPAISKAINSEWMNSNADKIFGEALEWSIVYNTSFVKLVPRGGHLIPYMVDPHCFGVYREDISGLDRQEAFAHRYYITQTELSSMLENHPNRARIIASLMPQPLKTKDDMPEGLRRVLVSQMATASSGPLSPGNTITGNGLILASEHIDYRPGVSAPVVEMTDLYVRDDERDGDYQIVTMADGGNVIYDRENFFVPGEQPFIQVCPMPLHGYFWGVSLVAKLIGLQGWRNIRMEEINKLLAKQARPPTSLTGWSGMVDETSFALDQPGGVLNNSDPMGKVEQWAPKVTEDLWHNLGQIDEMFSEAAALPPLLMGRGETGVRSGRQTSELSRLGSSRIKKRALAVEDALDTLTTKMFKALQRYDDNHYLTTPSKPGEQPVKFLLKQAPDDAIIKVDAHSNSPLFVEDQKGLAFELFEAKAIDRATLIEQTNPPQRDVLLKKLPLIEAREQAAAKAQADHETQMAQAKHGAAPGSLPNGAAAH